MKNPVSGYGFNLWRTAGFAILLLCLAAPQAPAGRYIPYRAKKSPYEVKSSPYFESQESMGRKIWEGLKNGTQTVVMGGAEAVGKLLTAAAS